MNPYHLLGRQKHPLYLPFRILRRLSRFVQAIFSTLFTLIYAGQKAVFSERASLTLIYYANSFCQRGGGGVELSDNSSLRNCYRSIIDHHLTSSDIYQKPSGLTQGDRDMIVRRGRVNLRTYFSVSDRFFSTANSFYRKCIFHDLIRKK